MASIMRAIFLLSIVLACAACNNSHSNNDAEIAALKSDIAALKARPAGPAAEAPVELGQQMLEVQIRHARLWQAGEAHNWVLAQFEVAELREAFNRVIEHNGDAAALQPERLADVLPAMINPPLKQLQQAIDAQDVAKFETAYDALSTGCSSCHAAAGHAFLVIQRPKTPILDNLRSEPTPAP